MTGTATGYGWGPTEQKAIKEAHEHAKGIVSCMGFAVGEILNKNARRQGNSWTASVEVRVK